MLIECRIFERRIIDANYASACASTNGQWENKHLLISENSLVDKGVFALDKRAAANVNRTMCAKHWIYFIVVYVVDSTSYQALSFEQTFTSLAGGFRVI